MSNLIELTKATCRSEKYTNGLKNLIDTIKDSVETMVEVGSYQGESTIIFAQNMTNLKKIYAVDPWLNGYCPGDVCSDEYPMDVVESNFDIRVSEYPKIIKQKMLSKDFVYIDGDHTYEGCKSDITLWLPKVKKGGYIGGHDYLAICFLGVVTAVDEFFGSPDMTFDDTSWLKKI